VDHAQRLAEIEMLVGRVLPLAAAAPAPEAKKEVKKETEKETEKETGKTE
jgi:hypothetical protein